ncbi:MAG TPA: DUF503 domain-containing protein [bacterium]|nr:DUF503 domain-containing protein [Candidatus Omnitrophota bacterium]HOJ59892.1 DUF503 domain-containing protein [bacterium]HOL94570.1 DUF503 domain-containing protein [bacterium]HPP01994.1 DUF503 domain-containing protein [bacterium]HXK94206.1 DUF503 domain-containing protein [bacterium]
MIVGILEVTFHIPGSQSLKDKRQVVHSLKDRIRRRFNVSLAETDGQDSWQDCSLAVAMVATQRIAVERELNRIVDLIHSVPAVGLTDHWIEYF